MQVILSLKKRIVKRKERMNLVISSEHVDSAMTKDKNS